MEKISTRPLEGRIGARVSEPNRVQVLLWVLFVIAGIVFATSVMTELGTIAGLAACLMVGIACAKLAPEQVIPR